MKRIIPLISAALIVSAILFSGCARSDIPPSADNGTLSAATASGTPEELSSASLAQQSEETEADEPTAENPLSESAASGSPAADSPSAETPTPAKEIDMRALKLKFDKTDLVSTEYDPKTKKSGAKTEYALWYSTDFIDISGEYALSYVLAAHRYLFSVAYFDAEKNFLSGEHSMTVSRCATVRAVSVIPDGAAYARFTNFVSGGGSFEDPFVNCLSSREDYDEFLRLHPRANFTVALLGDSLTEGDQGTNTPGYSYMNYRNYPYYLSEILDCRAENFGKCGYTTESYLNCYTNEVDVSAADLILVMLGTNAGMGSKNLQQKYKALLKQIDKDKKENAVVVLVTPPHATEIEGKVNYGYAPNVVSAAEYVRSYAASKGYVLIDAYSDSPIQEENEGKYQPNDGLHMNSAGYKAFAEFIAAQLKEKGLIA